MVFLKQSTMNRACSAFFSRKTQNLELQKRILPCLIDNTKRPAILHGFLYIDFNDIYIGYLNLAYALNLVIKQKVIPKKIATKQRQNQFQDHQNQLFRYHLFEIVQQLYLKTM